MAAVQRRKRPACCSDFGREQNPSGLSVRNVERPSKDATGCKCLKRLVGPPGFEPESIRFASQFGPAHRNPLSIPAAISKD